MAPSKGGEADGRCEEDGTDISLAGCSSLCSFLDSAAKAVEVGSLDSCGGYSWIQQRGLEKALSPNSQGQTAQGMPTRCRGVEGLE